MKRLAVLAFVAVLAPVAAGKIWTSVYRSDGITPLPAADPNDPSVYQDIMVGTRLVVVLSSDTGLDWLGCLVLSWDDWGRGTLSGRGMPDELDHYEDSCLEAAGGGALAQTDCNEPSTGTAPADPNL